jgi:hypothetical protein
MSSIKAHNLEVFNSAGEVVQQDLTVQTDGLSTTPQTITNTTPNTDGLTIDNTTASKGLLVNGKIVGRCDNGAAFAVKGLQDTSEGSAVVGNYEGIFTNTDYDITGTLKTRFICGGNNEMDVELQSPHQLRLTAGANDTDDGGVRISAVTNVKIMARGANEVDAPRYLVVDRVDQTIHADPLTNNSSDVTLSANAGTLQITGNLTGNVSGNVTGNLTGTVTGGATLDLPLAGGTMVGNLIPFNRTTTQRDATFVKAQGTITYGSPTAKTAATKAVTYGTPDAQTAAVAATPSGVLTFGAPSDNSTVIFTGLPTDGPKTFTKKTATSKTAATLTGGIAGTLTYTSVAPYDDASGNAITVEYVNDLAGAGNFATVEVTSLAILVHMDDTAVTGTTGNTIKAAVNADPQASLLVLVSGTDANVQADGGPTNLSGGLNAYVLGATEFQTINQLTALIQALTDLNASNDGSDITLTVVTAGAAMNSATVTGTSSYAALSITFGSGANAIVGSTLVVDGNTFTCVSGAPGANEFSVIAELTTLVNAIASVNATDNGSIISIVAAAKGAAGNSIGISKTGAGLTFTGPTHLEGGLDGSTVTVNSVTSTCIDSAPGANEFTNITQLTALVTAISGIDATDNGSVVAVVAAVAGTAGNSLAMGQSGAGLAISGPFLTGGLQPTEGALIFNTSTHKLNVFTNGGTPKWEEVTSA